MERAAGAGLQEDALCLDERYRARHPSHFGSTAMPVRFRSAGGVSAGRASARSADAA